MEKGEAEREMKRLMTALERQGEAVSSEMDKKMASLLSQREVVAREIQMMDVAVARKKEGDLMVLDATIEEMETARVEKGNVEKMASVEKGGLRSADMDLMPCRRHLREGPVEDSAKAGALHGIKALLKEDPASCYICVARAAALDRIEAAGGDSIEAAKESELRANAEVWVIKRAKGTAANKEEVGVAKKTKVRSTYFRYLLTAAPLKPLRPLRDCYFEDDSALRQSILAHALNVLPRIDKMDNILRQFLEKGYAITQFEA